MRAIKRNSKLWQFLHNSGVLDSGNEELIREKKKEYYRLYDLEQKHKKRKSEKRNFTVSIPPSQINHVRSRARQYQVDIPDYIKLLIKADIKSTAAITETQTLKEILQILRSYKNTVKEIEEKEPFGWLSKNKGYDELVKTLASIEQEVLGLINKKRA